jgi:hypothetical protein
VHHREGLTMRSILLGVGLLLGLLLLAGDVNGQRKKGGKRKDQTRERVATDEDYVALGYYKEVFGKLLELQENKSMKLKVEYQLLEPKDPSEMPKVKGKGQKQIQQQRLQQQLLREYQKILNAKNPYDQLVRLQQFQNRVMALQAADAQKQFQAALDPRNNPFKPVKYSVEFELPIVPDVRVARATLPVEYDDKGNVVEYTKDELKKRKDPKMPGFTAKFEDLQVGQIIKVYLRKPKKTKATDKDKDKDKDAAKDKEEAKDKLKDEVKDKASEETKDKAKDAVKEEVKAAGKDDAQAKDKDDAKGKAAIDLIDDALKNRPQVRMILILQDADPTFTPTKDRKGKKKQNE